MPKKLATAAVTGFDVLIDPQSIQPAAVTVIVGDDGFLQHEVRRALIAQLCGDDPDAAAEHLDGERIEYRDLHDALSELSLFGSGQRVIVLEDADDFVKNYRDRLEDYVAKPRSDASLLLEVTTWPSNTRLAKAVAESGLTIRCATPAQGKELTEFTKQLKEWLAVVARREFNCELLKPAADLLVDLIPPEPGILYQEVARLSLLAEPARKIDANLVQANVGGWRTRKTWDMIDAAADGRAADALQQLDRLIAAGEKPHALLPQMASTLRKFALAVRLFDQAERRRQAMSIRVALERAGFTGNMAFKLNDAERQLKQIGRPRARQLYRWLLAADLATKDYNSSDDRARRVIETLIIRLSQHANAPAAR